MNSPDGDSFLHPTSVSKSHQSHEIVLHCPHFVLCRCPYPGKCRWRGGACRGRLSHKRRRHPRRAGCGEGPKTVENFVAYVKSGHYDGTVFHRVIPSFMIQGGGMTADLREKKTEPPVVNEAGNGLKNLKYTLAMARTPNPNSATSQFFINVADNAFLDRANSQDGFGYAVFGKVVSGQEVVDKIAAKKTTVKQDPVNRIPMEDVPAEAITIVSAKLVEAE
jgi:peptidyl-prolyl cis-trans isomerase A (cyclophilin A)